MFVYIVFYHIAFEGEYIEGVFSSYDKARSFELELIAKMEITRASESTSIRKVELDKDYGMNGVGEEV
jgi:hypothetical protein